MKKAFGQIHHLKGEGVREIHSDLNRCALIVGDERGMAGRAVLAWKEYRAAIAPIRRQCDAPTSWGGRPVGNLPGDDLQPPPVVDTPFCERSSRGPAANRGLMAHGGFKAAVVLSEIARRRAGGDKLRGFLTLLSTYILSEEDAGCAIFLHIGKLKKGQKAYLEENGLYPFCTHK